MEASTPAVATAFRLLTAGSSAAIASARAATPARSPDRAILAGAAAWCRGDIRSAESSLRAALAGSRPHDRAYAALALAALLCACGRYARAGLLLAGAAAHEPAPRAAEAALHAIVHAATGANALAQRDASAARATLRGLRDAPFAAHVRALLAQAAYLRGDVAAALAEIEFGLRATRDADAARPAAALHAVAVAVHRRLRADADASWRHAQHLARCAERGGDAPLLALARRALCELAAERGDDAHVAACCAPPRAGRSFARDADFGTTLAAALRQLWSRDWIASREILGELACAASRSRGERALCRALLALVCVGRGDDAGARRSSRRAVSSSARPAARVAADELRRLRLARVLAAVAGELAGDAAHARRAVEARFLHDDDASAALWRLRDAGSPDVVPASVRGYARVVAIARERALHRSARGVLTASETDVVRAIAAGLTIAAIAARSGRSPHTVRTHLRNASAKLEAHGRADLLARARATGAI